MNRPLTPLLDRVTTDTLLALGVGDITSIPEMARRVGIHRGRLNARLVDLSGIGLAERFYVGDSRKQIGYRITEKGRATIAALWSAEEENRRMRREIDRRQRFGEDCACPRCGYHRDLPPEPRKVAAE